MKPGQTVWSGEKRDQLVELWKNHSESEIAKIMGVSRNAVAGALNRARKQGALEHDTPPRGKSAKAFADEVQRRAKHALAERLRRAKLSESKPAPAPVPFFAKHPCSLLELDATRCRWPCGDPEAEDFYFCGGTPLPGKPYCPYHRRLALQPRDAAEQLARSRALLRVSNVLLRQNKPNTFLGNSSTQGRRQE